MLVPLSDAVDESLYGGKAAQLALALRGGLPVPPGFVLDHTVVERVLSSPQVCAGLTAKLGGLVAVRSSGVGEDAADASFAGQHATILGVRSDDALRGALHDVFDSAHTDAAIAYRRKLGLDPRPRMAIVIQQLVRSDVAGVLFTRNPVDSADERVIEASWGLGEAVVQGLVVPDHYRVARGGSLLAHRPGEKDIAVYWSEHDGTVERAIEAARVAAPCLGARELAQLDALASRCEALFGGSQDLEFAFEENTLYLLQRRAITRG